MNDLFDSDSSGNDLTGAAVEALGLVPGRLQIELRYLDGFGRSIAHLSGRVGGLEVVAGYRIGLY